MRQKKWGQFFSYALALMLTISVFAATGNENNSAKEKMIGDSKKVEKTGAFNISKETPLSGKGTLSFLLQTDKTYKNGFGQDALTQLLVELPNLAGCYLQRTDISVNIFFLWAKNGQTRGFHVQFPDLPGPEKYFLQFSWDSEKGLCDGYMNGISLRFEGTRFAPWQIMGKAESIKIPPGPNVISNVTVTPQYTPKDELRKQVPRELLDKNAHLLGKCRSAKPMDVEKRKGKLLYTSKLDTKESVKDWILEGPGDIRFEQNKMIMRSQTPEATGGLGHFNYWCPMDFSEHFVVEWDCERISEYGFCIIHFAALGVNGQDIFDPELPKRNGIFKEYVREAIDNYYISYFAHLPMIQTGRLYGNMRKNNRYYIVDHGPVGIPPGKDGFSHLQLIRDGAHIQLLVDGKVSIDFTDIDSTRYGPPLKNGKIGFRQMSVTEAAYKNFKVWELRQGK